MADGILGLLGAGVDKVQGLLSSPVVQGIGAAALTGVNPLVGLLAAPIIQNTRERKSLENEALRQAVLQNRRRSQATQDLRGLLSDDTAVSAPIGLMNVEGGVDVLPAGRRVPTVQTQGGQERLLGLLSQIAPAQTAQSLLAQPAQERAETSLVRNARVAAGIGPNDPITPEVSAIVREQLEGQGVSDDLLKEVQLRMNLLQLENAQRERRQEERTRAKNRRTSETSLESSLEHLQEAAALNERLAPTLLRSGASFQDARRAIANGVTDVKRLFGIDTSEAEALIADYDRFRKLNSKFIIGAMSNIGGEGLGTVTNDKLSLLMKSMAGAGISPGANNLIYADTIDQLLQIADIEGFDVANRAELERLERSLRGIEPTPTRTPKSTKPETVDLGGGVTLEFLPDG